MCNKLNLYVNEQNKHLLIVCWYTTNSLSLDEVAKNTHIFNENYHS